MINKEKIKTVKLEDLINRVVEIKSFKSDNIELIVAHDIKAGRLFVLKEILTFQKIGFTHCFHFSKEVSNEGIQNRRKRDLFSFDNQTNC